MLQLARKEAVYCRPGLREVVEKKYPGAEVVKLTDLVDEYDRTLYKKDHGDRCPGLVQVDFYGDGKPTWAFVLATSDKAKARVKFLVGHKLEDGWKIRLIGSTDDTPVIWSEKAGKHESVYKTKTIRAKWPVVVVCGYESWAIVYAWMGIEWIKCGSRIDPVFGLAQLAAPLQGGVRRGRGF